jgi:hypothetical protein
MSSFPFALDAAEPCPTVVTPVAPTVTQSQVCEEEGSIQIPSTEGVTYWLDGKDVSGQTLSGPLSGTITATADEGYVLSNPEWSYAFDVTPADTCPTEVTATSPDFSGPTCDDQTVAVDLPRSKASPTRSAVPRLRARP